MAASLVVVSPNDIDKWQPTYRGEGNLCLVLSNRKERKVYRFFKVGDKNVRPTDEDDINIEQSHYYMKVAQHETKIRLKNAIDYVRCVIKPVLGTQLVPDMEIVELPREILNTASHSIQQLRPKSRLNKWVNITEPYALSMCDMTLLPEGQGSDEQATITVEIKPKCGFIPQTEFATSIGTGNVQSSLCQYCLMQQYKYKIGKVQRLSSYCPLNLFSGDRALVTKALYNLIQNPQNNFRLFINGVLLNTEHTRKDSGGSTVTNVPVTILHQLFPKLEQDLKEAENEFIFLITDVLLRCIANNQESSNKRLCGDGTILHKILQLQKLSTAPISQIYKHYLHLEKYFEIHSEDRSLFCLDGPYTGREWDLTNILHTSNGNSIQHNVNEIKKYLISRTARDCQIMIAFQQQPGCNRNDNLENIIVQNHERYLFHVGVIDLDPKPYHKIPIYYQQERDIQKSITFDSECTT